MLELVLHGKDGAGADAELLRATVAVETVLVAGLGKRGHDGEVFRDEPGDVRVPVVVVADAVSGVDALLVFDDKLPIQV